MKLAGWGNYPELDCNIVRPRNEQELRDALKKGAAIARGNGRAYGDSALNQNQTIDMRQFNRMLDFNNANGLLTVEAGVLLADIIETFLGRGWFPAVTPGTKFVTIGGLIAADVHGKNHHKDGSFASFIEWIDVRVSESEVRRCSRHQDSDLFAWTIGGMGLTGIIEKAAFYLRPVQSGWIEQTTWIAENLDQCLMKMRETSSSTYSVAWIDCLSRGPSLGRSILMLGEHAEAENLPQDYAADPFKTPRRRSARVPFTLPPFLLNQFTIRAFNALYYWNGKRNVGSALVDWDSYFYPLDSIKDWNKIYGRNGFMQFQCAIPDALSQAGLSQLLELISRNGSGSFLAVLKQFGTERTGLSFPMRGFTLALDFPINKSTLKLASQLDKIVLAHQGRFYLAKDSRMSIETWNKSEPRGPSFRAFRQNHRLNERFSSAQSQRLGL